MNTAAIEITPAEPIAIPQVEVAFELPRKWFDQINKHGLDLNHRIDCFVTSFPGKSHPRMCYDNRGGFTLMENRHGEAVTRALTREVLRVSLTIRKDLWEMLEISASNLETSCHRLLLLITARALATHKEFKVLAKPLHGADACRRASAPVSPGRIVSGPWS